MDKLCNAFSKFHNFVFRAQCIENDTLANFHTKPASMEEQKSQDVLQP